MTAIDRPFLVVEGAFRTDDDGNNIWSDITDRVELDESRLSVSQRRQLLFDEPSPGTLGFTASNDDGALTDTNEDSPFYPGVSYDTPLRVRVQYPATTNLLGGAASRTGDPAQWTAEMGSLDVAAWDDTGIPAGHPADSVLTWDTGVIDQTGVRVMVDAGPWTMPGSHPVYVTEGQVYSASIKLAASASIDASLRLAFYDTSGIKQAEYASATASLSSSSWSELSVLNKAAPADGTLRIAIVNETTVLPSARTITFDGGSDNTRSAYDHLTLRIPSTAQPGDLAILFRRISDSSATFLAVDGWSYVGSWSDARGKTRLDTKILASDDLGTNFSAYHSKAVRAYGVVACYADVDQASPLNTYSEHTETAAQATHDTPSVTTTVDNCMIVSAAFDVSTITTSWGAPAGDDLRYWTAGRVGNAATGALSDVLAGAAGSYGSKTFTSNVASKYATTHTLALKPASGTGPDNVTVYAACPMVVAAVSMPSYADGGDWHDWITAYADAWEPYWQGNADPDTGGRALVAVSATDRTKLLESLEVGSAVREMILSLGPVLYYPLGEASDSTEGADISAYSQPSLKIASDGTIDADTDHLNFGEGTGPGVDGTAAVIVESGSADHGYYLMAENLTEPLGGTPGLSIVMFWNSAATGSSNRNLISIAPTVNAEHLTARAQIYGVPDTPELHAKIICSGDGEDVSVVADSSTDWFDGKTHLVGLTAQVYGGQLIVRLYVDGELEDTSSSATKLAVLPPMTAISVAELYSRSKQVTRGTYSHVAVINDCLADEDMAELWAAGTGGYAGETVPERLGRLLAWGAIEGADLDHSDAAVDRHIADEMSMLDALRLATATDGGTLYIDGRDLIAFRSILTKEAEADPALTLSLSQLTETPSATKNDALLVNDVTVNRLGAGTSQRLTDADSIARNQRHVRTIDTLLYTDEAAREVCGYYLAFYADPVTRFDTISVNALLMDDWAALLGIDMWQIIRLTDLPSTAPAASFDSHMEGRSWSVGADDWTVTFDISYAIPFAIVGTSGSSALFGQTVVSR